MNAWPQLLTLLLVLTAARPDTVAPKPDTSPPKPIPRAETALRAIERILRNPSVDDVRPEYPLIFDFAERSDKVHVTIGEPFFAFSGDKHLDASLLAYFIAGAVKFDLTHPERSAERGADTSDAIRAALVFYRAYHKAHPQVTHELFERFDELDKEGKLEDFVKKEQPPADPD
jgi:hypothetical protein